MAQKKKRAVFSLKAPEARAVYLVGNFNGWAVGSDEMTRDGSGVWKKTKYLPAGRYEYRFVVDGEWITDPDIPETVANSYGTLNSVFRF